MLVPRAWAWVQDCQRVFVAAWSGEAVRQQALHPPFNLMLRLLVALCPDIIIPVSPEAAAAFDEGRKPFESGEGITEDYSVQQHTSANTALEVPASSTPPSADHREAAVSLCTSCLGACPTNKEGDRAAYSCETQSAAFRTSMTHGSQGSR